jgi:hypothetical protein
MCTKLCDEGLIKLEAGHWQPTPRGKKIAQGQARGQPKEGIL